MTALACGNLGRSVRAVALALAFAWAAPGLAQNPPALPATADLGGRAAADAKTASEQVVAGLSEHQINITTNFSGSEILVYGAVKREAPIPEEPPLQVIVTLEGPPTKVAVRKKGHVFGIWINTESVVINSAPSLYIVATSGPLDKILSATDDLRYHITIPRRIHDVGLTSMAPDSPSFIRALIRIREQEGLYALQQDAVTINQSTLFSTRVKLPANLTEGRYKLRIFLTRGGKVVSQYDSEVGVYKTGLERWLYRLSQNQAAIYGFLSLAIAVAAGWLASAAFQVFKR